MVAAGRPPCPLCSLPLDPAGHVGDLGVKILKHALLEIGKAIAIAVFLEALVAVFEAAKQDMSMMLYPTLLMFVGVTLIVGLGIFQRLSIEVEMETGGPRREPKNEAEAREEKEEERES